VDIGRNEGKVASVDKDANVEVGIKSLGSRLKSLATAKNFNFSPIEGWKGGLIHFYSTRKPEGGRATMPPYCTEAE
jgi:hypothetical protein